MTKDVATIVEDLVESFDGKVGVGFKDLETGEEFFYNGDTKFFTASVFKVYVIIELFSKVIQENINLEERYSLKEEEKVRGSGILEEFQKGLQPTIRDLARLMMIISDNTATDLLIHLLGKEDIHHTIKELLKLDGTEVNLTVRELLDSSKKGEIQLEENDVTTPKDMVKTLALLYKKEILTPEACEDILSIMKDCKTGSNRIKQGLPDEEEITVANKTGTMSGIVNDTALIYAPETDYILSVFVNDIKAEDKSYVKLGSDLITELSKQIYKAKGEKKEKS